MNNIINVLLCLEDMDGNYTRHCAVTMISLLETNKKNKIKIWIMSSFLPKENIDELKRIVKIYNQDIEFIIRDDIIPENLKNIIINTSPLTRGVRYRWFFPSFIKGIDRILCLDCDVLVMKDISEIYFMDMHGKAIAGYLEPEPSKTIREKYFGINNYINNGVLLFDAKKYDVKKLNVNKMIELNEKFSKYYEGNDQDKTNIIFNNDIFVYKKGMNYIVERPFFNKGIGDAEILHVLAKPYTQYSLAPKNIRILYNKYLNMTKWKDFPKTKKVGSAIGYIYSCAQWILFLFLLKVFGKKIAAIYGKFRKKLSKKIFNFLKNKKF